MGAVLPVRAPGVSLVAGEADVVLGIGCQGFRAWIDDPADAPAPARLDVGGPVTVTGNALAATGRSPRIDLDAVFMILVGFVGTGVAVLAHFSRRRPSGCQLRDGNLRGTDGPYCEDESRQNRNQPFSGRAFSRHLGLPLDTAIATVRGSRPANRAE